ncbi:MAG: high light inducible protein [Merismopedia sp. SIO2A8]|nr:high light inducible protein [Merismopedia sp. SIO2A8]
MSTNDERVTNQNPASQSSSATASQSPSESSSKPAPPPIVHPEPAFGWTSYAEQINGRFAMLGFLLLLVVELFTHQDFFTWLGLR